MTWSKKREPDLLDDLSILLGDLCVEWGFCDYPLPDDLIVPGKALTADEFAHAVLTAEGLSSERRNKWFDPIRDKFIERYGSSISFEAYVPTPLPD